MFRTIATIAALALGTAAPAMAAPSMNMSCSHSEGSYNAVFTTRANSYPTPDVLIHAPGFTLEFDHVRGTEYYNLNGQQHVVYGGNGELRFRNLASGQTMVCTAR